MQLNNEHKYKDIQHKNVQWGPLSYWRIKKNILPIKRPLKENIFLIYTLTSGKQWFNF
jgi:hypothetical protein